MRSNVEQKSTQAVINFLVALSGTNKKATLELFLELTDEQKLICASEENDALFTAVVKGHGLNLIQPLTLITDPVLFFPDEDDTILKRILDSNSKKTQKDQLSVLDFFLKHIKDNNIYFDVLDHMEHALSYSADEVAARFLSEYSTCLNRNVSTYLLDSACGRYLMPKCMDLLINSHGRLADHHSNIFSIGFCHKKYLPKKNEIEKIIDYFIDQKITIPILPILFLKEEAFLGKEILIKHLLKKHPPEWKIIEKALESICYNGSKINHDLILECYKTHPHSKISNPEKLIDIALDAIKLHHPLIHILLEKGMDLNELVNYKHDYNDKISIEKFRIPLANYAAFYSVDEKLLQNLQNNISVDAFNRTPAHYAALAMPFEYGNPRLNGFGFSQLGERLISAKLFDFKLIGSSRAFKNSNLTMHWDTPDLFGFTPLMYAATHLDPTQRNLMLNAFKTLLLPILFITMANFPTVLINMIADYIICDPINTDLILISWAQSLISRVAFFNTKLQEILIDPLKKYFDYDNNFIPTKKAVFEIRNSMHLFTNISLMESAFPYGLHAHIMVNQFNISKQLPSPALNSLPQLMGIFIGNLVQSKSGALKLQLYSRQPLNQNLLSSVHTQIHHILTTAPHSTPIILSPCMSLTAPSDSPFKTTSCADSFFSYKNNKRPRSDTFFNESPDISWKEIRDSLIEQLRECYTSGSRLKLDLKLLLQPYIHRLYKALNVEDVLQCMESINNQLAESNSLTTAIDKYGLREYIKGITVPNTSEILVHKLNF